MADSKTTEEITEDINVLEIMGKVETLRQNAKESKNIGKDIERFCEDILSLLPDEDELVRDQEEKEERKEREKENNEKLGIKFDAVIKVIRDILDREPDIKLRQKLESLCQLAQRTDDMAPIKFETFLLLL